MHEGRVVGKRRMKGKIEAGEDRGSRKVTRSEVDKWLDNNEK